MRAVCRRAVSASDLVGAIRLRVEVFMQEQGMSLDDEIDEHDGIAQQFVAVWDGKVIATARARRTGRGQVRIERVAVKKAFREKGVGSSLMRFVLGKIRKGKPGRIWLSAETAAQGFYERLGFVAESGQFMECGLPHVSMRYAG